MSIVRSRAFLGMSFLACSSFAACGDSSSNNKSGSGGAMGAGGAPSGGASGSGGAGAGGASGSGMGGRGGGAGAGGASGSGGASGGGGSGMGGMSGAGGTSGSGGASGRGGSGSPDAARDTGGAMASADGPRGDGPRGDGSSAPTTVSPMMSFFLSSKGSGKGGNYGGLDGADAHCKALATAVSPALGAKTWRAYLSTSTVNARTRIGMGPWLNAKGEMIAKDLETLHMQAADSPLAATWPVGNAAYEKILDEKGATHPGAVHDILTGTNMMGMADGDNHCNNWTSEMGMATVGHSNRDGGNRPPSWTTAHQSGCGSELDANGMPRNRVMGTVTQGGGRGSIYCFAVTP
jgi:hypothetical protein